MESLGIMQPYFFPYLGYYSNIFATDHWVIFDIPQFRKRSWMTRNQILSQSTSGNSYISLVTEGTSRQSPIHSVSLSNDKRWREKVLGQLNYYRKAPFYKTISNLVQDTIYSSNSLAEVNTTSLEWTLDYLGISFNYTIASNSPEIIKLAPSAPGLWAPKITKELGFSTYINPPGGKTLFSLQDFSHRNIKLKFLKNNLLPYKQGKPDFTPGLSIIDVLMFNSRQDTVRLIKSYEIYE